MGDLSPSSDEGKAEAIETVNKDVLTPEEVTLTQRDIVTSLSKLLKSAKEGKVYIVCVLVFNSTMCLYYMVCVCVCLSILLVCVCSA